MATLSRTITGFGPAAVLCLMLFASPAFSQVRPMTTDELTRRSDVVAVGQVRELSSEWDETGTRIRTRVTLVVDQFVKGNGSGNILTLYVPGGEVGSVGEVYSHMPTFQREERVVVFAEQDKQHHYRVSGGQEGKLTIERDQVSGKSIVAAGRMTLQDFTSKVITIVKSQQMQQPVH